jgi:6-pyruvoyltetrahydropterin/6-carboxytetrahydropterin synthase
MPTPETPPRPGAPVYRICKTFDIESGHMLSKHPGRCRFPHGHSRRVEVVVASSTLDENDMVCDFAALKHALADCLDRLDHAMCLNSQDPALATLAPGQGTASGPIDPHTGTRTAPVHIHDRRLVIFHNTDPTTEVLARYIYDSLVEEIRSGGNGGHLPTRLIVERVRVGETSSSWAEYGI